MKIKSNKPYMSGVYGAMKGLRKRFGFGSDSNVRHRCTCYLCGSKLVNLYFVNGSWKCKKCKEKDNDASNP